MTRSSDSGPFQDVSLLVRFPSVLFTLLNIDLIPLMNPEMTCLPALNSQEPAELKTLLIFPGILVTKLTTALMPVETALLMPSQAALVPLLMRFHPPEMTLPRRFHAALAIPTIKFPKFENAEEMNCQTPEPICLMPSHARDQSPLMIPRTTLMIPWMTFIMEVTVSAIAWKIGPTIGMSACTTSPISWNAGIRRLEIASTIGGIRGTMAARSCCTIGPRTLNNSVSTGPSASSAGCRAAASCSMIGARSPANCVNTGASCSIRIATRGATAASSVPITVAIAPNA